ncbi:hypothetical protein HPB48_008879 [Haemaphysalis longicornis]|uniref:Transposable element P transposase-like RNase H C-terminal domain-containing protein n=1 Tax=Haemaphysalis longicornis TaxID=44386 RepID=A0A9J6H099_HAELO|nr:hypothetical protein HPB48_008879 [Haemaphysalis longicornis]
MTSRFTAEALRPSSPSVDKLHYFLSFLSAWEKHTNGKDGFLSQSTATGLRVTLSSVLSLLEYLAQHVGFKYVMTSRLSQDPAEHLFGIVRQSSGCNSHPTPQQFVVTVNCLAFKNLAHSVSKGNCEPGVLSSLLDADACQKRAPSGKQELVDKLLDEGNIDAADTALLRKLPDHSQEASSDSRLIFYIAGYVARKSIWKTGRESCLNLLLMNKEEAGNLSLAEFTRMKDNGGLLYPSPLLYQFVADLENAFTTCFSLRELHSDSILDIVEVVKAKRELQLGCPDHCKNVAAELTAFYLTTRLHFSLRALTAATLESARLRST